MSNILLNLTETALCESDQIDFRIKFFTKYENSELRRFPQVSISLCFESLRNL